MLSTRCAKSDVFSSPSNHNKVERSRLAEKL